MNNRLIFSFLEYFVPVLYSYFPMCLLSVLYLPSSFFSNVERYFNFPFYIVTEYYYPQENTVVLLSLERVEDFTGLYGLDWFLIYQCNSDTFYLFSNVSEVWNHRVAANRGREAGADDPGHQRSELPLLVPYPVLQRCISTVKNWARNLKASSGCLRLNASRWYNFGSLLSSSWSSLRKLMSYFLFS